MSDRVAPLAPAFAMASRWRRRPRCLLDGAAATLRTVSASAAIVDTDYAPPLGARVTLTHPDAGLIDGVVAGTERNGVRLSFAGDARAMGFALAALAADMSVPR